MVLAAALPQLLDSRHSKLGSMTEAVAAVGYDFCLPEIGRICHVEDLKRLETELGVTVHLQQSRAGRPLEILELGAGLSLPGFVAALLGVRYWDIGIIGMWMWMM